MNKKLTSILDKFHDAIYKQVDETLEKLTSNGMDSEEAAALLTEILNEMHFE